MLALVIGLLDYALGYELSLVVIYLLPVQMVTLALGLRAGMIAAVAVAAIGVSGDYAAGAHFSSGLVFVWKDLSRIASYWIAAALLHQLHRAWSAQRDLAVTDGLTGLLNYRGFMGQAAIAIASCRDAEQPLTALYLDCDRFKQVNDQFGHEAGNDALRVIALTMRRVLRPGDSAGRIGGDEFVMLLPGAGLLQARERVDDLRSLLQADLATFGWPLGVSVGIASFAHPPRSARDLIGEAEHLMYGAKRSGRTESAAL